MKHDNFEIFWKKTYIKAGEEIVSFLNSESESIIWDSSDDTNEKIWKRYNYYRRVFHNEFFYGQSEDGKFIDYHKVSACFTNAIIDISPISFDLNDDLPWFIKASNYFLAFSASIYMLHFFTLAYYRFSNPELYERAKLLKRFSFPMTTIGHDTYKIGRIKAMALNDINNIPFDLLGYSDMLFWIEHFNRQIIENTINVKSKNPKAFEKD